MEFIWKVLAFLLMITPLVFIHELGHFLLAKLFNVKVNTFSIFMGKKLLKKKWGETEYCVSMIPIGGYVSLVGEDPTEELPPEDEKRALYAQKPLKRFLIVAAGPVFNIILAIAIYMSILAIGDPVTSNKIARVVKNSVAYNAGLRPYDRIVKINDAKISNFRDVHNSLRPLLDNTVKLEILRGEENKTIFAKTQSVQGLTKFGKPVMVGSIPGIEILPLNTVIGVNDTKSLAYISGLRTGDKIIEINNNKVALWYDLEKEFRTRGKKKLHLLIEREGSRVPFTINLNNDSKTLLSIGLETAELYVLDLLQNYPAQKAGILKNDRLYSINNKKVFSFKEFYNEVQSEAQKASTLNVQVKRDGKLINLALSTKKTEEDDAFGRKISHFYIGVKPYNNVYAKEFNETIKTAGFVDITKKAVSKTYEITELMLIGFVKLLTGSVSPKQLSGPLMIGKIAGDFLSLGILFFLKLMALISLNLAIINLLPIPALDGGHILILFIEFVIRRKIPTKAVASISYFGFILLLTLMAAITFNDIVKLFF